MPLPEAAERCPLGRTASLAPPPPYVQPLGIAESLCARRYIHKDASLLAIREPQEFENILRRRSFVFLVFSPPLKYCGRSPCYSRDATERYPSERLTSTSFAQVEEGDQKSAKKAKKKSKKLKKKMKKEKTDEKPKGEGKPPVEATPAAPKTFELDMSAFRDDELELISDRTFKRHLRVPTCGIRYTLTEPSLKFSANLRNLLDFTQIVSAEQHRSLGASFKLFLNSVLSMCAGSTGVSTATCVLNIAVSASCSRRSQFDRRRFEKIEKTFCRFGRCVH